MKKYTRLATAAFAAAALTLSACDDAGDDGMGDMGDDTEMGDDTMGDDGMDEDMGDDTMDEPMDEPTDEDMDEDMEMEDDA